MTAARTSLRTSLRTSFRPALSRLLMAAACASALSACNATSRIAEIGSAPRMSGIQNPQAQPGYQPVSLPMPAPQIGAREPNSLWRAGARAFFKDQRAGRVGDILTVTIDIDDRAQINNQTARTRENSESAGLPNFLGLQEKIGKLTGTDVTPENLVELESGTNNKGTGTIQRRENIRLQVAALVTDVLPNGNLVIQGKQEVRVNYELRELAITGVIRPEDVASDNRISYEKIAEARISYGGRGQIMDVQQPRYGQQLFDIIMPF
jgi:flagellar L-ring protein precursor FlgH